MGTHQTDTAPHRLVFGLYSEDGGDSDRDFRAMERILRGMLRLVEPQHKEADITVEPTQPDRSQRVHGSFWKVNKSKDQGARHKRTLLLQHVATALSRDRIVFFHVDGDSAWAEQAQAAVWADLDRFRKDLLTLLQRPGKKGTQLDQERLAHAFIAAVPFHAIESWAYANTRALRTRTTNEKDLERIASWERDLGQLDEEQQVKTVLSVRDRHNFELFGPGFPARNLHETGKSYAHTVERLRGSPLICEALTRSAQRPWG